MAAHAVHRSSIATSAHLKITGRAAKNAQISSRRIRMHGYTLLMALILGCVLLIIPAPSIGNTNVSVQIVPGTLTFQESDGAEISAVVLRGNAKIDRNNRQLSVADARGNGEGWNMTIASGDFKKDSNPKIKIPAKNLSVAGRPEVQTIAGNDPPLAYTGQVGRTGIKILSARPDTGMGSFRVNYSFDLEVPSDIPDGRYTATITETLTPGP